jgi:hypothetical protein
MDEEQAQIEEVLQRGEHLLHEPMEDSKKEKIRLQLLLLHTRYNKIKVGCCGLRSKEITYPVVPSRLGM